MRSSALFFILLVFFEFGKTQSNCSSDLAQNIANILNQSQYRTATWGISISGSLDGSNYNNYFSLLEHNFRVPASNNKLLTTSALFPQVNVQNETFQTQVFVEENPFRVGEANGCVVGSGDPSLTYVQMQKSASTIKAANPNLKSIEHLQLDSSLYSSIFYGDGQPFTSSWEWEDIGAAYGAHPSSAIVEENAFYITVTGALPGLPPTYSFGLPLDDLINVSVEAVSVSSSEPSTLDVFYAFGSSNLFITGNVPQGSKTEAHLAAINAETFYIYLFSQAFEEAGISVQNIEFGSCDHFTDVVDVIVSPTWDVLLNHTLQESDNLYAESWIRVLGSHTFSPFAEESTVSTLSQGISTVSDSLNSYYGVPTDCHRQVDGSGVSSKNLVSPECIITALKGIYALPNGDLYISFLPLAGESGTLSSRFIGTDAQGKVRAKTGTLTGTNALSGFVENPNFESLLFSIIVNESPQFASVIRQGIDAIVELLPPLDPNC